MTRGNLKTSFYPLFKYKTGFNNTNNIFNNVKNIQITTTNNISYKALLKNRYAESTILHPYYCSGPWCVASPININYRSSSTIAAAKPVIETYEKDNETKRSTIKTGELNLPDFNNHKQAFKSKSMLELCRAYFIFKLCSVDVLVKHQLKLLKWMRKMTGKRLFTVIMKKTLYGHFLAGEGKQEVALRAEKMSRVGVAPMLAYTAAEMHGHSDLKNNSFDEKQFFQGNIKAITESVEMAADMKYFQMNPICSSKLTFIKPVELLRNSSSLILLHRSLIAKYKDDSKAEAVNFMTMVDDCVKICNMQNIDAALMNLEFHLQLRKLALENDKDYHSLVSQFNFDETELRDLEATMDKIGKRAEELGVSIFWDAEQTYLNPVIHVLALDCMRKYNTKKATVYYTYQCYLKETYDLVTCDTNIAKKEGFCWAGKIVRGAYMDEERRLAKEHGYDDPVNVNYDATTASYYKVADYIMGQVVIRPNNQVQATFATHNEDTVSYVTQRMNELGIDPSGNLMFAQLLGMRDHITLSLGNNGIPVGKLLHYGPVEDCVAYLSRRVMENRGAIATADHERRMHGREIRSRITRR